MSRRRPGQKVAEVKALARDAIEAQERGDMGAAAEAYALLEVQVGPTNASFWMMQMEDERRERMAPGEAKP
jgi:hypothetical protein